AALEHVKQQGGPVRVEWTDSATGKSFELTVTGSLRRAEPRQQPGPTRRLTPPGSPRATKNIPEELARLLDVPVYWTAPTWVREDSPSATRRLDGVPVLVLTDQPAWCLTPQVQTALGRLRHRLVSPASAGTPGAIAIDLTSSTAMEQTLRQLDDVPYEI